MRYKLSTPYKGKRHYIQGGDLFVAIQAFADSFAQSDGAYINKLSLFRFAYHLCELSLDEHVKENDGAMVGYGQLTVPGNNIKNFTLYEGSERPHERRPFDEDELVRSAVIDRKIITLQKKTPYTTIEVVIALTKNLNYHVAQPKTGKWVFGQIDLNQRLPLINNYVSITHTKGFPGRFSANEIVIDGNMMGVIQFIEGTP